MTTPLTPREAIWDAADLAIETFYEGGHNFDVPAFVAELDRLGYVVVPKEPTEEMVEAGRKAMDPEKFVSHARTLWVYGDMIAAAPKVGG